MVEVSSIPKQVEVSGAGTIVHTCPQHVYMLVPINHEYITLYDKRELREHMNQVC